MFTFMLEFAQYSLLSPTTVKVRETIYIFGPSPGHGIYPVDDPCPSETLFFIHEPLAVVDYKPPIG